MFFHFFPLQFVEDVVLPQTNKAGGEIFRRAPVTLPEFKVWLGLVMQMSLYPGAGVRAQFWAQEQDELNPLPMLGRYMSRRRFESIFKHLTIWESPPPLYRDPFFQLREFFAAWHEMMFKHYRPSWLNCGDESMCFCSNPKCPGFILCPRKPKPTGNEYNTLADNKTRIVFSFELREGKDAPPQIPREGAELGAIPGIMVLLTKPIRGTGNVGVWDSGFCVLRGLVNLRKRGIFSAIFVKKRKYWPKNVPCAAMKDHLSSKPLGTVAAKMGEYRGPECPDGIPFWLCGQRDRDYVLQLMCTYGTTEPKGPPVYRGGEFFPRAEPFADYYTARNAVDNANNRRQGCVSIEEGFETRSWWKRQFIFILAMCETNACNAYNHFGGHSVSSREFRKVLAKKLLESCGGALQHEERQAARGDGVHKLGEARLCRKVDWGRLDHLPG
mmetsp:Transcript_5873/g.14984  ORF Transcript_5873/g.14984 Transcript_5873/m.14984 type:complete len:441 (+) Transcript_5873:607-1929(+)